MEESENCRYLLRALGCKDSIDNVGSRVEKCANITVGVDLYDCAGVLNAYKCRYSRYLEYCEECEYCLGCISLKKKKYCILNKQYTKEEYENIHSKVKQELSTKNQWGSFFPLSFARGGYNMSNAQLFWPETSEHAKKVGYIWEQNDELQSQSDGISPDSLPDNIYDATDDVTAKALLCPDSGYRFNIASNDLDFYRQHEIPLPRQHPDVRMKNNNGKLIKIMIATQKGKCHFCDKDITHYYPSEVGYKKIVCIECYQQNIL